MATLGSWQKLSSVVGSPWGTGADGSTTISADPNTRATVTGTATQSTSTIGTAILSNGNVVMLHQTQGTGAGQWEFKRVLSGGGTTSITWTQALKYTYGTGAQVIKVPQYTTATVNGHTVTAWDGTKGGIEVIVGKISVTFAGSINCNGTAGAPTAKTVNNAAGGGFLGGYSQAGSTSQVTADQGDSSTGTGTESSNANGMAGGGGHSSVNGNAAGGGGGHVASGGNGTASGGGSDVAGTGGGTGGSADLTTALFGGAGGGGSKDSASNNGTGGNSGGIVFVITKSLVYSSGSITCNGGAGGSGDYGSGGGGAGGSILFVIGSGTLPTSSTASGGNGGTIGTTGGNGSAGRIAVHHQGTVTGTTTPTFNDTTDSTLVELGGLLFMSGL